MQLLHLFFILVCTMLAASMRVDNVTPIPANVVYYPDHPTTTPAFTRPTLTSIATGIIEDREATFSSIIHNFLPEFWDFDSYEDSASSASPSGNSEPEAISTRSAAHYHAQHHKRYDPEDAMERTELHYDEVHSTYHYPTKIPKAPTTNHETKQMQTHSGYTRGKPYPLPSWEQKNRSKWISIAKGRPLPNEGSVSPPQETRAKATENELPSMTSNVPYDGSHAQEAASATITPRPDLSKRQVAGPVPIPYIPKDWTTSTVCPAVQGLPCATTPVYLPFLQDDLRRASAAAARASSLAYVPGMNVPCAAAGLKVAGVRAIFGLAGVAMLAGIVI